MEQKLCPTCHQPVTETQYFCANCGANLKPKPLSVSVGKQIGIYALSFFLPPLGLWPGVKYLMDKGQKAKIIGTIAIVLTIVSCAITVWMSMAFVGQLNKTISKQVDQQYQDLGL